MNLFGIILLSLPCVLGYNVWSWDGFSIFGGAVLDLEDFLVSNILLPLGSLVYLLFCTSRYGWGWKNFKAEANTGKRFQDAGVDACVSVLHPAADDLIYLWLWHL